MTDEKKIPNVPAAPLDNSVPTETPKLLQQDLGLDRRAARPALSVEQLQKPEYAHTVIKVTPRDPSLMRTESLRLPPARPQPLRQPLASRPLQPSVAPASAMGPGARAAVGPSAQTVVNRALVSPASAPTTDPMQQPDVLAAIERSSAKPQLSNLVGRLAIPPSEPIGSHTSPAKGIRPLAEKTLPATVSFRSPAVPALPGVAMPPSASRTELRRPAAPKPAEPVSPAAPLPIDAPPTVRTPQVTLAPLSQAKAGGLLELTPAAPREAVVEEVTRAKVQSQLEAPAAPQEERSDQITRVKYPTQLEVTPAAPREAPIAELTPVPTTMPGWASTSATAAAPAQVSPRRGADSKERLIPQRTHTAMNQPMTTAVDQRSDQVLARPASLWRRAFSCIFDLAVIAGTVGGLLFLAVTLIGTKPVPNHLHGIDAVLFQLHPIALPGLVLTVVLSLAYTTLGAVKGRTLGRALFGIRLVDASGKAPGAVRAVFRAIFALVSFTFFLAGFWLALFDRRGQTLHDKLTQTFVVRPV